MKQLCDLLIDDPSYHSFMVRLWRAPERTEHPWHCEIEDIQSGEIVDVFSLEELVSWIAKTVNLEGKKSL